MYSVFIITTNGDVRAFFVFGEEGAVKIGEEGAAKILYTNRQYLAVPSLYLSSGSFFKKGGNFPLEIL